MTVKVIVETKGMRVDLGRAKWFKSSASGPYSDNCFEIAFVDQAVLVRDSKHPDGPALVFTHDEWRAACAAFLGGEFNLP